MQIAERVFCYKAFFMIQHTSDTFRYPSRVSCKNFIIVWGSQMSYQAQFRNELIDQLLRFHLSNCIFF